MTTKPRHGLSPATIETVAGLSAGLVSTIIVHPLDIIKTRLQLDTSSHPLLNSSRTVFRDILRNEGPTRLAALYRGLTPNLIGNSSGWALYFLFYKQGQDIVRQISPREPSTPLTSLEYLAASAGAGVTAAILTNPIWVIKTRMLSTSADTRGAYTSMISGLRSIYTTEGVRGYFHGLIPTLAGVSHGALYFMAYEKLKVWRRRRNASLHQQQQQQQSQNFRDVVISRDDETYQSYKQKTPLSNFDTILTSCTAKVFAGSLTYPHQVVRARMQTYNPGSSDLSKGVKTSIIQIIKMIWEKEGILGFYKGLAPNLVRVLPSTCVTFLVYENMKSTLPGWWFADNPARHDAVSENQPGRGVAATAKKEGTF